MGFYGNITNTNKTQFTFDRTYSSRALMENRIKRDEIYLGRYVLVEYDADNSVTLDTFVKAYKNGNNFYTSPNFEQRTRLKMGDQPSEDGIIVTLDQVIYVEESVTSSNGQNDLINVFYICSGNGDDGYAVFKPINTGDSNYATNYNIDKAVYGNNRGYDSTVWQKIYVNDKERFIMIAELNTRTPSFDLVVDAPTMTPITPHFGTDSTNMNYKLHWQPQWGLRVGKAEANEDGKIFSDVKVKHIKSTYDPEKDETISTSTEVDGAIYYNAAGLNKNKSNYDKTNLDNYIKIEPTGSSGVDYLHGNGIDNNDIYEMKIHLPAIGNMVSSGWDALIGNDREGDNTKDQNSISWLKNNLENQILTIKVLAGLGFTDSFLMTDSSGNLTSGKLKEKKAIVDIQDEKLWAPPEGVNNLKYFAEDAWIYGVFNPAGGESIVIDIPVLDKETGKPVYEDGKIKYEEKTVTQGQFTFYHNFTSVDNINSSKDISVANNSFTLDIPIIDATGHVVGYDITTFNLPKLNDSIMCAGSWLTKSVNENTNVVTISHKENTIETVNYSDQIEDFQVIATGGTKENHVTKVINVKKDDFSLYWKGMTDN